MEHIPTARYTSHITIEVTVTEITAARRLFAYLQVPKSLTRK